MSNKIIVPKNKVETLDTPVIFLAGPIACAGGWQNRAIEIIRKQTSVPYIVVPDYGSILDLEYVEDLEKTTTSFDYQLEFEQYYLEIAEKNGAILIWHARQLTEMSIDKQTGFTKPYARDTRGESGGWGWGSLRHCPNLHVAVGGEDEYSGISVVRRNFAKYAPQTPFRNNLEQTCEDALKFLNP
jgi:hypothetical protein